MPTIYSEGYSAIWEMWVALEEESMNKVEAFIRPEKLDNVKDALANEGILGLSVIQVTGRGVQRGVRTGGRGTQSYMASMLHQSKIEIVVSDADTQKTCQGRSNLRTRGVDGLRLCQ